MLQGQSEYYFDVKGAFCKNDSYVVGVQFMKCIAFALQSLQPLNRIGLFETILNVPKQTQKSGQGRERVFVIAFFSSR